MHDTADVRYILTTTIELEPGADALLVTLNRPAKLNAITRGMYAALGRIIERASSEPAIRVVMITGSGKYFSVGGDLTDARKLITNRSAFEQYLAEVHETFRNMRKCGKPIIALVNGVALAGGLELVLSCDFSYAAASANFGDCHQRYGMVGGGGLLARCPGVLGPQRTAELVYTGRILSASEAADAGIVVRVVDDSELLSVGLQAGRQIATASPTAIATAKEILVGTVEEATEEALRREAAAVVEYVTTSPDAREGLDAFVRHRDPHFGATGRDIPAGL